MKPLKGVDPGLLENLESFFELDYPDYELIFSVADPADPAYFEVERVIRRFPQVDAKLIAGDVDIGPNPKVNNLIRGFELARHDLILISDSNIRVDGNYLRRMVGQMDPQTGLVTAVVTGKLAQGLGGWLESVYLNTFFARWMILLSALRVPTVMGKSMLFRKSDWERFGGFKALSGYLAEDHMAGQAMHYLGLKTRLMTSPVFQVIGNYSFATFWQRHLRWGRMRKSCEPFAFFLELLFSAGVMSIIAASGFHALTGGSWSAFLAVYLTLWLISDLILMATLETPVSWKTPTHWLIREVLQIPLWFHIQLGNTVKWRGGVYRLFPGSVLALDSKGKNP